MDSHRKMSEQLMDAAACEALGANTPMESAAYQQEVASAGEDARRLDRDLRETVARLSAASPHLRASPDLRGRILQATAPATFRMEDYRKATRDNSRFYRWGFYAAMICLAAGASYNLMIQKALTGSQHQQAALLQHARESDAALAAAVSPQSQQVILTNNGSVIGRAFVNENAHTAVVVLPQEAVPAGMKPAFSMPKDGKMVPYQTSFVTVPAETLQMKVPGDLKIETVLNPGKVEPDTTVTAQRAGN